MAAVPVLARSHAHLHRARHRLCHVVGTLLLQVVSFPLAIIAVTYGCLVALVKWDWKNETFDKSYNWIKQKTNYALLSALGIIFPQTAYKFRDANLTPYVIALRIAVISAGCLYALSR